MAKAARAVADTTDSAAIVVYTQTGRSARVLSKLAPGRRIVALSPDPVVSRRLALCHGVTPLTSAYHQDTDTMLKEGDRQLLAAGLVQEGDTVVVLGGTRQFQGATNLMQLRRIEAAR
jgi:pyruvate kinase